MVFVMAALNINSLLAHFYNFFVLNSKIDVLAINETKIDSSVNDNEIHLPGFQVVRKDRSVNGRSGGGVRGTQREYSSKPLKRSIVKPFSVFER